MRFVAIFVVALDRVSLQPAAHDVWRAYSGVDSGALSFGEIAVEDKRVTIRYGLVS